MATVDPNSYEALIQSYNDIAAGAEEMNRSRMENYSLTQGGRSTYYGGPGGAAYGPGVPGTVITYGAPAGNRSGVSSSDYAGLIRSGASRPQYGAGGGVRQSAYAGPPIPRPEYQAPKFNEPGALKLPEWKPPERDPKLERGLRQEYMSPGMSQIRRTTQEAVISSKSLDNPNARALFIQKTLSGLGQAIESVASGAGKEARAEAGQRYSEALSNYTFGFKALAEEKRANWDAQWRKALAEYSTASHAAQMQYQTQASSFLQQPLNMQANQYGSTSNIRRVPRTGAELRAEQQAEKASHPTMRRIR